MTATLTAETPTCPNCAHTERIAAVAATVDPDRLADRVRAELDRWTSDEDDVLWYGPGHMLLVDVAEHEVWEGEYTRTPDQQLRLALLHLAAALAAGARI